MVAKNVRKIEIGKVTLSLIAKTLLVFVGRGLGLQGIPRKKNLKLCLRGGVERSFIKKCEIFKQTTA